MIPRYQIRSSKQEMGIETALGAHGYNFFRVVVLFCGAESGYGSGTPGAALAGFGLIVLASGILFARWSSQRPVEDNSGKRIRYTYALILTLIILGCFLTTFGVAFILTFTFAC